MGKPPAFSDIGKDASDLFTKGYNYGEYRVEAKTKSESGVKFTATGSSSHDTKNFVGSLESKYKCKDYGLLFTNTWNTDNTLESEVTFKNKKFVKGLTLALNTQFTPQTGKKSGQVKTEFKHDHVHANLDVDFNLARPTILGAAVVGHKGWLAGAQVTLDTSKTASALVSEHNLALGYSKDDISVHWALKDCSQWSGSLFQKVSKKVKAGFQMEWTRGSNETKFALAAKYSPDKETTLMAKLNNATQIGLCFQHELHDGVTLALSTHIEAKNFNQGGHKFGIGLEFDA